MVDELPNLLSRYIAASVLGLGIWRRPWEGADGAQPSGERYLGVGRFESKHFTATGWAPAPFDHLDRFDGYGAAKILAKDVTGNTGTVVQSFKHRNALYQMIRIHDAVLANTDSSSNNGAIRLKDGWADLTIRLCEAWDGNTWSGNNGFINLHGQDQGNLGIGATDIAYNMGFHPSDALRDGALVSWSYGAPPSTTSNIHVYRNSFAGAVGENCYTSDVGTDSIESQRDEGNIFQYCNESASASVTNGGNLSGAE